MDGKDARTSPRRPLCLSFSLSSLYVSVSQHSRMRTHLSEHTCTVAPKEEPRSEGSLSEDNPSEKQDL